MIYVDPKTGKASSTQQDGMVSGEEYARYNAVGKGAQAGGMTAAELADQTAAENAAALWKSNPAMAKENEARNAAAGLKTYRYVNPGGTGDEGADFFSQFKMPDEAAIREEKRKAAQAMVDTINQDFYSRILPAENTAGADRLGRTRSMASRSGTLESDFGGAALNTTDKNNKDVVAARDAARVAQVASIFDNFDQRATDEINNKTNLALQGEEKRLSYLKTKTDEARTDFKTMAGSGVVKSLSDLGQDDYQMLLKQTGYSDLMAESVFNASKPKAKQIDYKIEKLADGKMLFYGQDPTTGELVTKNFNYDVPEGYTLQMTTDGTPLLFNKDSGEVKVAEGFKEGQFQKDDSVKNIMDKYPDAGVTLKDTLEQAQAKLPKSKIYQDQVRGPQGSTTAPTSADWDKANKFLTDNPDATYEELDASLRQYTKLGDADIKSLISSKGKVPKKEVEPKYLTSDYVLNILGLDDVLATEADEKKLKGTNKDNYIADEKRKVFEKIKLQKEAGKSDKEIEQMLLKDFS